jgi:pimeloyl-ACP methyl ester carboxylesterase
MGFNGDSLRIQGPQGRLQVQVRGVGGTPIILVHGNGAHSHAQVPGCESSLVPDCSHWIHLDQPEAFNTLVEAFLTRCAAGAYR